MAVPAAPVTRRRAMAVQAIGGYLNTAILIVQGLLLVPLYLRFIGPHAYGLWLASGGILGLLNVMNIGFGSLLIQRIASAYGEQDPNKAGAYFVNGMAVYLLLASVFAAAGVTVSFALCHLLKTSGAEAVELRNCFQLAVLGFALGLINEGLRGFAQALLRPLFPVVNLVAARMVAVLAIVYLLYHGAGMMALAAGIVITEVAVFACSVVQSCCLFRGLGASCQMDRGIIREYFRIGGALFASRVGSALSSESDPLLIAMLLTPESAAAYVVTRRAADIVFRLVAVIYGSSQGAFSHLVGEGDHEKTAATALRLIETVFFLGLVGFASYVAMNASFVSVWVGKSFVQDHLTILLVGVAFLSSSLRNMLLQILNGLGSFNDTSLITLSEGVAKFGLAASFLKLFGVAGAPLSLLVASSAALLALSKRLGRRIRLPLASHTIARSAALLFVAFGLAHAAQSLINPAASRGTFFLSAAASTLTVAAVSLSFYWRRLPKRVRGYLSLNRSDW